MQPLLLTSSSFKKLREENYVYVDKTKWIHQLLTTDTAYFLSRPRRFGKSTTLSTLEELFKGNKNLFKGLYIEDKWDFTPYPVIVFDFNEIVNESTTGLAENLLEVVEEYAESYEVEIKSKILPNAFRQLIMALHKKYQQEVVVLVDEYDTPLIDHIGKGKQQLQIAEDNRVLLENLFRVLKGKSVVDILKFVFVTGVSRFTKVSIFSKWNNLIDISTDANYAGFLGYSDKEVRYNFKPYLEQFCTQNQMDQKKCLQKIKHYYNGYRFSMYSSLKVYNPISLMSALKNQTLDNYWFSTATPSFLVYLLKERDYYLPEVENIEIEKNFLEIFDIKHLAVIPLLFQTGYLTIVDYRDDMVTLAYPNKEVKDSFNKILLHKFNIENREVDDVKIEKYDRVNKNFSLVIHSGN